MLKINSFEDEEESSAAELEWDEFLKQSDYFTITKMTPGVKDQNRVNVFLDGHFAFSLDISQVVDLEVKVGQKIDQKRLKELQDASEFGKLYQRTLEWAVTRPHSLKEAQLYLKRKRMNRRLVNLQREKEGKRLLPEVKEETSALVIERLLKKGYIDDLKFAKFYVENRYVRRGISQKRLRNELFKKGVADNIIKEVLGETERTEDEEILKVIQKKRKKYPDDFKLIRYLVRQGFDFSQAKDAVEKYKPEGKNYF